MKPRTLAGQMLELKAAGCDLMAEIAKTVRKPDAEKYYRDRAASLRCEWHELERPS